MNAITQPTPARQPPSQEGQAVATLQSALAVQARNADAFTRLLEAANSARCVREISDAALDCLMHVLEPDRAAVLVFDAGGVMRFVCSIGLSGDYQQGVDGHSPWQPDTINPTPVLIEDAAADLAGDPYQHVIMVEGIRAMAFIPLVCEGVLLGKFMLYQNRPHHWEAEEIFLARYIADHVALTVARLRSQAELATARDHLELQVLLRTHALEAANQTLALRMEELEAHRVELLAQQEELFAQNRRLLDAQAALLESERRYRAIVENSADGITLLDHSGRIIEWNAAQEAMTGIPRSDALGRPMWELMWRLQPRDQRHSDPEIMRAAFERPLSDPDWTEKTHLHVVQLTDGARRVFQLKIFRIQPAADFSIGSVARDVTEQQAAQEQIRQYNERLEEMVAERSAKIEQLERQRTQLETLAATGRMAARIAHEINNPLAGVLNGFQLLKAAIPPDYPYFSFVPRVENEIERIARIVRQMYGLYRPNKETEQRLVVRTLIDDVVQMLLLGRPESDVAVQVQVQPADATVQQRSGLLRQVLFNLVQNALDVSPSGSRVEIAALATDTELHLSVRDQGPGIPVGTQPHVFEPFFTTKEWTREERLGLGLSVSQSAVHAMGGSISFESTPGAGATFFVVVPI